MKTLLRHFVCFVCFVGLTAAAHAQKNVQKSDATATRDEITGDLKFGSGKTLTVTGAFAAANATSFVMPATVTGGTTSFAIPIVQAAVAYVETSGSDSTGTLGRSDKPFATINAALDALPAGGGVIRLGVGAFAPLTGDASAVTTKLKDNVIFLGSGRPDFNSGLTGLTGGTIIKGPILVDRPGVQFHDLGVDSGSAVCTALYSGTAQEGLIFVNVGQIDGKTPRTGIVVRNVAVIAKTAASAVHAALFENLTGFAVDGLHTVYGTYGLVLKSTSGVVANIRSRGHGSNALLVKSDTYAPAGKLAISNFSGASIATNDTAGISFDSRIGSGGIADVTITSAVLIGTTSNLVFLGVSGATVSNIRVSGFITSTSTANSFSTPLYVDSATITINGNSFAQGVQTATATAIPSSSFLLTGSATSKVLGEGPALSFAIPANTDGGNVYTGGRILVSPDSTSNGTPVGRMYLQTRGPVSTGTFPWVSNATFYSDGTSAFSGASTFAGGVTITGAMNASGGVNSTGGAVVIGTNGTATTNSITFARPSGSEKAAIYFDAQNGLGSGLIDHASTSGLLRIISGSGGSVTVTNGSTLAATFTGANTSLAGTLGVTGAATFSSTIGASGTITSTGGSLTAAGGVVQAAITAGDIIALSGNDATDTYYLGVNYTNYRGSESVGAAGRASWRLGFTDTNTSGNFVVGSRAGSAAVGAFTSRLTLTQTGAVTFSGSVSPSASTVTWTAGSGAPSASEPNGSLYSRTDGTGPNLYVRENGAWVAK